MSDDEHAPRPDQEPLKAVPDLKGAPVIDANGHVAGELFGSLAEVGSGLLRYLDLALLDGDKHVLVPIGHARVERKKDTVEVQLRAATREELGDLPQFTPGEDRVQVNHNETLDASARSFSGERYYAHPAFDHKRLYVGDRPVVRATTPSVARSELGLLSEMDDFDLADDRQDVRDWPVQDANCEEVGVVDDLVIDTRAERVRYLLVRLGLEIQKLVPVGYANLDEENEIVCTPELDYDDLRSIPDYAVDELTRVKEEAIRASIEARLDGARRFCRPDYSTDD
jgi:sporulation protein YlmC with PRC-barrel domain